MIALRTILQSLGLGVGLAMDAFSVSVADGLAEPRMGKGKKGLIAFTFAFFQFMMPVLGWICVHTISQKFSSFEKAVPWIALILLLYIGGKMLKEGIGGSSSKGSEEAGTKAGEGSAAGTEPNFSEGELETFESSHLEGNVLTTGTLILQGVATSIDALSVGFAFASYTLVTALFCSFVIGVVTFLICIFGLFIGNRIGNKFTGKAEIVGGIILILIGIEIFVSGVFF